MNREATDLAGVRHIAYETLGSTNAEALARARAGERGPLWITAKIQADRPRPPRQHWTSPPGNLYASLLLSAPSAPACAPQLSFVAVLALHDAVAECAPQVGPVLKVKWPNDLLIGGAKVAGHSDRGRERTGLCRRHRLWRQLRQPSGRHALSGDRFERSRRRDCARPAVHRARRCHAQRLLQWQRGHDFASIRADWLKRAAGLGKAIRVRLPEREFSGNFEGLDDAGRLLVRGPAGVTTVTAGEVFGFGGEPKMAERNRNWCSRRSAASARSA